MTSGVLFPFPDSPRTSQDALLDSAQYSTRHLIAKAQAMTTPTSIHSPIATDASPDPLGGNESPAQDGASGSSSNGIYLPVGGMVAIIVIVAIVALLAIGSGALFYMAKKREMRVRELVRYSTKQVIKAITPRRATFARELKDDDNVPPTPALPRRDDIERVFAKTVSRPPKKGSDKASKVTAK